VGDIINLSVNDGVSSTFFVVEEVERVDTYFGSEHSKFMDELSHLNDNKDKIIAWWNYIEIKFRKIYRYVS
jgi:hypothetical protein